MGQGWICLHRQIQNNWLWQDKPFSRGQAWIDLLLLVNHEEGKSLMDGELITIHRGEHLTSEVKLAKRWGWSRTKVRNFLELLEREFMIKNLKEGSKRTRLRICNYNLYQDFEGFWSLYPKKVEKLKAYKSYQQRLKEGYTPLQLLKAVQSFNQQIKRENRHAEYIKHCSTFLGPNRTFLDYLEGSQEDGGSNEKDTKTTIYDKRKWLYRG